MAILAGILLAAAAPPRIPPPSAEEVDAFSRNPVPASFANYPQQPLAGWQQDLRRALEELGLERAADALAPRYGLSRAEMRELALLWFTAQTRGFAGPPPPALAGELRRRLLALLAARRVPLVLQAAAESLDSLNECSAEDFTALMAGSTDPVADSWTIANIAECGENFARVAALAPERAMPALIRIAHYGSLSERDALPLYALLTRPEALARIAERDRPVLVPFLYRRYAQLLFGLGLSERAVALLDGLPEELRRRVTGPDPGTFTATVDGLAVTFPDERWDDGVTLDLATAYALAGRTAEAEALLATIDLAPARRTFDCMWRDDAPANICHDIPIEQRMQNVVDALLLDHFLHRPGEDPYPLAEAGFSGTYDRQPSAPIAELRCRVLSDPQFAATCTNARSAVLNRAVTNADARSEDEAKALAALEALAISGYAEARAELAAEIDRFAAANGPTNPVEPRPTTTPAPPPFAELPLPDADRGTRAGATELPGGVAALPEGFSPVRFERNGTRAVTISLSQTYDPTGEVSGGGYWVHLSDDGGRHWQRPLYTGLAQYFPYAVPAASRMRLLNGDRLDLEVEVAELDTASITYPPMGLRSRRRATGLYLQIPLAALARDQDGDGITDIAESRLLLDRSSTGGGTPFVVGSDGGRACPAPTSERLALAALLDHLFRIAVRPIVEPLDRPAGDPLSFAGRTGAGATPDHPIFIRGDPDDYRCLRPDRLMVVYSEADIAELERFRPDFHAVSVPPIIYNRARDRGFVRWSAGWSGGTFRLRRVDGRWTVDSLSGWVT